MLFVYFSSSAQTSVVQIGMFPTTYAVDICGDLCDCQNCDQVHIDDVSADDNGVDLRFVPLLYLLQQVSCLQCSEQLIVFFTACCQKTML